MRSVAKISQFEGLDGDGNAVYNTNPLPTLNVSFTTKIHGSNASCRLEGDDLVCQSRNRILGDMGHFGFPELVAQERETVDDILNQVKALSDWKEGEVLTILQWKPPNL